MQLQSHLVLDERLLDAPGAGLDDADVAVLAGRDHVPVVHVEGERVHSPVRVVQRPVLRPVAQVEDLEIGFREWFNKRVSEPSSITFAST